ncbi:MAG: SDR family NAD(P)-dependent oxidoreductase [Caldicoprobacterales bacterium]|jgi:NAD(P)-dependent dehydrogenase (short-subunit alcohol dehydrogenase family)|nr:SDR family oxidoreductase [Clostridiales bacterium]
MSFKNKTVMITGGASGMGFLSGQCFAKEGANVALVDIDEKNLASKCEEILSEGGKAIYIATDVRDYQQVVRARDRAVEEFGSIDILINSAGGNECRVLNHYEDFVDMPIDVYDWGLDVNLKGPFYFSHTVMKQMVKQKSGVIINIGSVTGEEGSSSGVAYATAKSGVMYGLTKSLAIYGSRHNVRVCCVTPGPVLTREAMAKMKTLIGRAAAPKEVVDFIMYLASDKAAFITGTNHVIDGGRLIMPRS